MSKIIFLNGGSSAGKSSIAREIMKQTNIPFLYFSIDHLVNFWIDEKFVSLNSETNQNSAKEWFFHIEKRRLGKKPTIKIRDGFWAKKM